MHRRPRKSSLLRQILDSLGGSESRPRRSSQKRRFNRIESLEERRLLAIGALDTSFAGDGKAVYAFDLGGDRADVASATAVDHDGKIVVVGGVQRNGSGDNDFAVLRYNPDGSRDMSFGVNGRQIISFDLGGGNDDAATSVAIDSSNRIVIGGYVQRSSAGDYDFGVARLTSSGALDTSFSSDGKQTVAFDKGGSLNDRARGVAIDWFGGIIVAGSAQITSGGDYDFAVARLTSSGSLDSSFGTNGKVTTAFNRGGSNDDGAQAVAIDNNGRIVAAGGAQFSSGGDYDFAVARYTSSGALDSSFSSDGKQTIAFDNGGTDADAARSVAIDDEGRIVLAGYTTLGSGDTDFAVARLTDSGSLDASFSSDGKATVAFDIGPSGSRLDDAFRVLIDQGGRIVLAGSAQANSSGDIDFAVARLLENGTRDNQFSGDGKATVAFNLGGANADLALGATLDDQGQLVVVGATQRNSSGDFDFALARFLNNRAPVANRDVYVIGSGTISVPAAQGALANDSDPDGDSISGYDVGNVAHGTVSANSDGSFTYTPNASFKGIDRVTYSVTDGAAESNTSTVTLLSHDASIVRKFYLEVLSREPDDGGLEYWTGRVGQGAPFSAIFAGFYNSDERLNPIITRFYHDFLLRQVEPAGLAYWKQQYIKNGGPELVIAGMISSPEFFQSAGGTNQSYIEQLYVRLLGRNSDPNGLAYWTNLLNTNQLNRSGVVLHFQYSDENRRLLINEWHQLYLNRPATNDELALYLGQMKAGASQRQIQERLIDSAEYRNSPAMPAGGTATRLA
jgi:uncharacterized delta-60 repeat protein